MIVGLSSFDHRHCIGVHPASAYRYWCCGLRVLPLLHALQVPVPVRLRSAPLRRHWQVPSLVSLSTGWAANEFRHSVGGLFFPKAIQHVFVGLYVQQVCLAALFFLAQNENKKQSAIPEGAFAIILIIITYV